MSVDVDALARLEEERDFLLRSLRDLERERAAGDVDEHDYHALRDGYTARAATVLRALEEGRAALPPPRPRRSRRTFAVVTAIAALAALAGVLLATTAGERLSGQNATGSIREASGNRLAEARTLIDRGKVLDAVKLYDRILVDDAQNPEALAYRGWLVRLAGLTDDGLRYIDRAIAADPRYPDAHFFKGLILYQDKHDPASAIPELQAFLAADPPAGMATLVRDVLRRAQADAAGSSPAAPRS